jgi:hypothetical protein
MRGDYNVAGEFFQTGRGGNVKFLVSVKMGMSLSAFDFHT